MSLTRTEAFFPCPFCKSGVMRSMTFPFPADQVTDAMVMAEARFMGNLTCRYCGYTGPIRADEPEQNPEPEP